MLGNDSKEQQLILPKSLLPSKEFIDIGSYTLLWIFISMLKSAPPLSKCFFSINCLDSNIVSPYFHILTPCFLILGKESRHLGGVRLSQHSDRAAINAGRDVTCLAIRTCLLQGRQQYTSYTSSPSCQN